MTSSTSSSSTSRWESSTRPLVVRTVWVNGLRHAILTPSLAFAGRATSGRSAAEGRARPSSPSSTSATSTASDESDRDAVPPRPPAPLHDQQDLAQCLVRWKLVVGQGGGGEPATGVLGDEDEGADADAEEEGEDTDEVRQRPAVVPVRAPPLIGSYASTFQHMCVATTPAPQIAEQPGAEDDDAPDGGSDTQHGGRRQVSGDIGSDLNPLSERVLQWLDLAGKATDGGSAVTKASLRRNVSTAGASRRQVPVARARRFYPVASSEVSAPGAERRLPLSAARRSISVDANLPPAPPRPTELRASPPPAPPAPPAPPPPLIQTFQHVASAARTWHHGAMASQSRPQLHIFVPAVSDKGAVAGGTTPTAAEADLAELQEVSDCESGISDA